jgi:hypothetical protein
MQVLAAYRKSGDAGSKKKRISDRPPLVEFL